MPDDNLERVRVVAGIYGGREIKGPKSTARPTTDKVRAAIFNSLQSLDLVEGAKVLDLFSGTGALGIEALSRGAESVIFVELADENCRLIRENLASLDLKAEVKNESTLGFLKRPHGFDLTLADPPYEFDEWESLLGALNSCVIVCESNRPIEPNGDWSAIRTKKYGGTYVTTMKKSE